MHSLEISRTDKYSLVAQWRKWGVAPLPTWSRLAHLIRYGIVLCPERTALHPTGRHSSQHRRALI